MATEALKNDLVEFEKGGEASLKDKTKVLKIAVSIGDLAREEENRVPLGEAGTIPFISKVLSHYTSDSSPEGLEILAACARAAGNQTHTCPANRTLILSTGLIPLLVPLLSIKNSAAVVRNTAGALANCANIDDDENKEISTNAQKAIIDNNAVIPLLELAQDKQEDVQAMAVKALSNLSDSADAQKTMKSKNGIRVMIDLLKNQDTSDRVISDVITIGQNFARNGDLREAFIKDENLLQILFDIIKRKKESDDDDEITVAADVAEVLAAFAEHDNVRTWFVTQNMVLPIVNFALAFDTAKYGKHPEQLRLYRSLAKTIGLTSLADDSLPLFFGNLPLLEALLEHDEATLRLSGLMISGNMARNDADSLKLVQSGVPRSMVKILENSQNDHRLLHMGLGGLKNMSIAEANKLSVVNAGALKVAIESLSTGAPVVNYEAITLARTLLAGQHGENTEFIQKFIELDGVAPLLDRTAPPKEDEDPRVMYEASRLLCRLLKFETARNQVGAKALQPILALSKAPFSLLRDEGTTALQRWCEHESSLSAAASALDDILSILSELKPGDPHDAKIPLRIFDVVLKLTRFGATKSQVTPTHIQTLESWTNQESVKYTTNKQIFLDLIKQMK